jgi:hypothetical protein
VQNSGVHNVSNSKEAEPTWVTGGKLSHVKFAFDDKINPKTEESKEVPKVKAKMVYLQLVHIDGKGSAILENGVIVKFK